MVNRKKSGRILPPGPKGKFLVGSALDWAHAPIGFLQFLSREYKGIAHFKSAGRNMFFLSDPAYIRHVLQENNRNYVKGTNYKQLKLFMGNGLLTNEGNNWLQQRRLIQPAFHKEKLAFLSTVITEAIEQNIENWSSSKPETIEVHQEMMGLALRIIGKALLSEDMTNSAGSISSSLNYILEDTIKRVFRIVNLPLGIPTPGNVKYLRHKKLIDRVIYHAIEKRKNGDPDKMDMLSMLMDLRDETGAGMPPAQLRDEVTTLFIAGHETTANSLTWTLYLLATHPEIEAKLHAELKTVLNGRKPQLSDIPSLQYTKQVISESMRLYPPVWLLSRKATGSDKIGPYDIIKDDDIVISPFVTHRDPDHWEDADKFNPERFTPENAEKHIKYSYFPFGGGPRFCIGSNFAMLEMQLVIASIYQQHTLQLMESDVTEPRPLLTLRTKHGIAMRFVKRQEVYAETGEISIGQ